MMDCLGASCSGTSMKGRSARFKFDPDEWWGSAGPWVIAPRECLNGLALRIKSRAGTKSETPPFSARAGAGALQRPFSVY